MPPESRGLAQAAVRLYWLENPSAAAQPKPVAAVRTSSALFAAGLGAAVHLAVGDQLQAFIKAFGADAAKIMQGEVYRAVTALLLHGDGAHLLANMAGILLFGTYTAQLYGWGLGWLLILLAGAQGNFLTAWWYGHNHLAIGASTAVFGALGLCAAMSFWRRRKEPKAGRRPWLTLAGALALVGWLGSSPNSDLMAHLLGFACGLLHGGLFAFLLGRAPPRGYQAASLAVVALLVTGSWWWGMALQRVGG